MSDKHITITLSLSDAWQAQIALTMAAISNEHTAALLEKLGQIAPSKSFDAEVPAQGLYRKEAAELRALAARLEAAIMSDTSEVIL